MSYNPNNTNNKDTDIVTPEDGIVNGAFTPKNSFYTLYNTKLQNIFTDYAASKAQIAKAEEESLQDAYYIKEMSKKYLGEYASNTGLGDVSGNLMDIHSTYAGQRQAIGEKRTEAELQLDSAYRSGLSQLDDLRFQYEEGVKGEKAQKVATWLELGDYGTRADGTRITDPKEFLDNELAAGNIDQAQYNELLRVSQYIEHQNDIETFYFDLENSIFEKYTDAEGNVTYETRNEKIGKAYEQGLISKKEYDRLIKIYDWYDDLAKAQDFDIKDFTSPYLPDGTKNPDFIQSFDITYFTNNDKFDKNSLVMNIEGVEFVSEKDAVDQSEDMSSAELTDYFEEKQPDAILKHGQTMYYKGDYYVYKQGEKDQKNGWYRMVAQPKSGYKNFEEIVNSETSGVKNWKAGSDDISEGWGSKQTFDGVTVKFRQLSALIEINGVVYQTEGKAISGEEKAAIESEFKKVHGGLKNTIIYYNGKLYHKLNNGKIKEMVKVKKQEKKSEQVNK